MKANQKWLFALTACSLLLVSANRYVANKIIEISPIVGSNKGADAGLDEIPVQETISFDTGQFTHTLARPLFAKTRRPFVKKIQKIVSAPVPKLIVKKRPSVITKQIVRKPAPIKSPGFQLAGILMNNQSRKAYLSGDSLGVGRWVLEGEVIDSWKLSIENENVVKLKYKNIVHRLKLYGDSGDN